MAFSAPEKRQLGRVVLLCFPLFVFLAYNSQSGNNLDPDSFEDDSDEFVGVDGADSFDARKRHLDDWCSQHAGDSFRAEAAGLRGADAPMNAYNFFIFRGAATAICSVHKTGSNSWGAFMHRLAEQDLSQEDGGEDEDDEDEDDEAPEDGEAPVIPVDQHCWPECAKNVTKVIVVRHPLQRLLSAWRHVFDRQGDKGPRFGLSRLFSWTEFVDRLLSNPADDPDWRSARLSAGDHWAPFWRVCSVCSRELRPDLVLRLETIVSSDLPAYLRLLRLPARLAGEFPHLVRGRGEAGTTSREVEASFYGQLSRSTVMALYDFFRADHELFGYSPRRFLQFAQEG